MKNLYQSKGRRSVGQGESQVRVLYVLYSIFCGHSHRPEIFILCLIKGRCFTTTTFFSSFVQMLLLSLQFSNPASCQFQQHLFIKHFFLRGDIMLNSLIGIVSIFDGLRQVTMLEVSRTSTCMFEYLLMYLYLILSIF